MQTFLGVMREEQNMAKKIELLTESIRKIVMTMDLPIEMVPTY